MGEQGYLLSNDGVSSMYIFVPNVKGKKKAVGMKLKAMRFVKVLQGKTRITEQK